MFSFIFKHTLRTMIIYHGDKNYQLHSILHATDHKKYPFLESNRLCSIYNSITIMATGTDL